MFNLLNKNKKYYRTQQVTPPPQILYTIDKLKNDLKTPMTFYRAREHWVDNTNVINRLMHSMYLDTSLDIVDYIESIDDKFKWVCRHFKIISPYSEGEFHDKDFYINQELYDDYFIFSEKWKDIAPIQPIMTDYSNLGLDHPQHMLYTYSINYIDIKALCVQYYYWKKEQSYEDRISDIEVYISQYVFTNMIPYYLDLSIIKLAFGTSKIKYKNTHSIYVHNRTGEVSTIMKKFRKYAKNKGIFYTAFMNSIPLVTQNTGLDYVRSALPPMNTYNFLIYFMVYGYYIRSMSRVMGKISLTANSNELSDLNILLRYYRSTRSQALNMEMLNPLKDELYTFLLNAENKILKV